MLWFFPKFEENFRIKQAYLRKWKEWSWSSRSSCPSPNRLHEMTSALVPHCSKAPDSSWNLLSPTVTTHKFHNIFDESGRGKKRELFRIYHPGCTPYPEKSFRLDLFICTLFFNLLDSEHHIYKQIFVPKSPQQNLLPAPVLSYTIYNKSCLVGPSCSYMYHHLDGSVQDCSISIANALEILQSCTKPSISSTVTPALLALLLPAALVPLGLN